MFEYSNCMRKQGAEDADERLGYPVLNVPNACPEHNTPTIPVKAEYSIVNAASKNALDWCQAQQHSHNRCKKNTG